MSDTDLPAILSTPIQKVDLGDVIDWTEKFSRQRRGKYPPFSADELVRVNGFIEPAGDGLNFHVDADGKVADNFFLVNPVDSEKAKEYAGLPLECIVRVLDFIPVEFQISDIQNYHAELLYVTSFPLINPDPTKVETTGNTRAVVYGEFIGFGDSGEGRFLRSLGFPEGTRITGVSLTSHKDYTHAHLSILKPDGEKTSVDVENPPRDYLDRKIYGLVRTEDGGEIKVYMPTGKIVFSGGNIENIYGKLPEKGDIIRISAKINDGKFFAHWCDPCFLVDPSEPRYSRAENLRLRLDHKLDEASRYIEQGNYSGARELLAEVRAEESTEAQFLITYKLAQKFPELEKPVMFTDVDRHSVDYIDKAFGVKLESMTAEEFTTFARGALAGMTQVKNDCNGVVDVTYLFTIAQGMGFGDNYIEDLAFYTIQKRIERMEGKKPNFIDKYTLDQTALRVYETNQEVGERIIVDTVRKLQAAGIEPPFNIGECYKQLLQSGTMIEDGSI